MATLSALALSLWPGNSFSQGNIRQLPKQLQAVNQDVSYASAYGAKCDGATDDQIALAAWIAEISANTLAILPHGSCLHSGQLSFPSLNNVTLRGAGAATTALIYTGASTTVDTVTFGGGTTACVETGWTIEGIRFGSNTIMTAGDGVHWKNFCRSFLHDIILDGQDGNGKFYNAGQMDGIDRIEWDGFDIRGAHAGLIVNGIVGGPMADLFMHNGKISLSAIGLNIAGNFGGFYADASDIIVNQTNVLIDQSQVAAPNLQLFFGPGTAIDETNGGANIGFNLSDAGSAGSLLFFTGTWIASSSGNCFVAQTGVQWKVNYSGGTIYNCAGDGVHNLSTSLDMNLTGTLIENNAGIGLNNTVAGKIKFKGLEFSGNGTDRAGLQPVLTACGGSPIISPASTDYSGVIEIGTVATGCTVTFSFPWHSQPNCVVSDASAASAIAVNTTVNAITLTGGSASSYYLYVCDGDR